MKTIIRIVIAVTLLGSFSSTVTAQNDDDFHPFLSDRFNIDVGFFWPNINYGLRVDGSHPDEEIDFDQALNLDDYQTVASVNFRWRFGKKWSFWAQGWDTSSDGSVTLTSDVEWEDLIFKEGTFVGGGIDLDVVRLFFGREFSAGPQHEFGIGAGIHWMQLDTFIEGEALINDGSISFERAAVSAEFPLPNIGAWYMYSWSPKWVFQSRFDWLSATIGNYSGSMWDAQVGVNYEAFKNIGFGLYYKVFALNVDVDKSDWRGRLEVDQAGPVFTVTATW